MESSRMGGIVWDVALETLNALMQGPSLARASIVFARLITPRDRACTRITARHSSSGICRHRSSIARLRTARRRRRLRDSCGITSQSGRSRPRGAPAYRLSDRTTCARGRDSGIASQRRTLRCRHAIRCRRSLRCSLSSSSACSIWGRLSQRSR